MTDADIAMKRLRVNSEAWHWHHARRKDHAHRSDHEETWETCPAASCLNDREALTSLARMEERERAFQLASDTIKTVTADRDRLKYQLREVNARFGKQYANKVEEAGRLKDQLAEANKLMERPVYETWQNYRATIETLTEERDEAVANGLRLAEELEHAQKWVEEVTNRGFDRAAELLTLRQELNRLAEECEARETALYVQLIEALGRVGNAPSLEEWHECLAEVKRLAEENERLLLESQRWHGEADLLKAEVERLLAESERRWFALNAIANSKGVEPDMDINEARYIARHALEGSASE